MENFNEQLTEEELKKLRRRSEIRSIAEDLIKLMSQGVPKEDMEKLIGKGFMEEFSEGQNVREKIMEGLKESSNSELETIIMQIETYKKRE